MLLSRQTDKSLPDTISRKMQKFIVAKRYSVEQRPPDIQPAKVKMSGYLKKKRSKVGGWRKMWFVLQNHLFMSYSSKEEYDKKLVSFKDVLNLVPGTIVRPLGGFRFTIETTTNTIYTFRCDDSKTCTEWITALLESLAIKPQSKSMENIEKIPKLYTSLNDISKIEPRETIRASASCDSIYQIKNDSPNSKLAKIPIAQNTARILERNGVPTKKMNKLQQIDEENESPKGARNFRLHERSHSVNQSDEVFRINQMFRRSISATVLTTTTRNNSSSRSGSRSGSTSSASSPFEDCSAHSKLITNALLVKQLQQHYKRIKSMNGDTITTNGGSGGGGTSENSSSCEPKYKCKYCYKEGSRDFNQNNMIDNGDCERTLEDEVQRLSLNDKNAYDDLKASSSSAIRNGDNKSKAALELLSSSSPTQVSRSRHHHPGSNHSPFHRCHHLQQHHHHHQDDEYCMNGARVNGDDDDHNCEHVNGTVNNGESEREIKKMIPPRLSLSSDNVNSMEPIYAVVDLKNKYEHRAKMRQLEELSERQRPKSIHCVSSDYEEVLNFSHESEEDDEDDDDDDSENIYEPINIPETIQQQRSSTVWKYFPKFHLEALIDMARTSTRKKPTTFSSTTMDFHPSYNYYNAYQQHQHQQQPQKQTTHSTTFSDIRRKFGNHRKSIKNRMKKFYTKDTPTSVTRSNDNGDNSSSNFIETINSSERNAYSDDELDSQGATVSTSELSENSLKTTLCGRTNDSASSTANRKSTATAFVLNEIGKYRRGDRHLFGSLSRLRKTRTSLCLDEDEHGVAAGKKKFFALSTPKSTPCFHHELRRELSRRSCRKS